MFPRLSNVQTFAIDEAESFQLFPIFLVPDLFHVHELIHITVYTKILERAFPSNF